MTEHGLATKTERVVYRVWRHVNGRDRRWITSSTRDLAEEEIRELREGGMTTQFGIERVLVTEESDGIEWTDS